MITIGQSFLEVPDFFGCLCKALEAYLAFVATFC